MVISHSINPRNYSPIMLIDHCYCGGDRGADSLYFSLVDLVSVTVAPLAKAILSRVGKEIGGVAAKGALALILGDLEQKALERALSRAFAEVGKVHGRQLANFDINAGF